jgi:adenine-specific DNA-methyltransferase
LRYIGSKARVARSILDLVGAPAAGSIFVDAFCGTGSVAHEAAERGWAVRLNDHLRAAVCIAEAHVSPPTRTEFGGLGGYRAAIEVLNGLPAAVGFIRSHYSPDSIHVVGHERRYLTSENAGRVDAVRQEIRAWVARGLVNEREERLLLGDLLEATSQVANTAGTYGCYLRNWSPTSKRPLRLFAREVVDDRRSVEVLNGDVWDVPFGRDDVAYFDPPYTKRQYAAYYHLLETIAVGDQPDVLGMTGLRPWRPLASDFCYKSRALSAISGLVGATGASRILLSYSSEGHVPMESLRIALALHGTVTVHELARIARYRPNEAARSHAATVDEYVIEIARLKEPAADPGILAASA